MLSAERLRNVRELTELTLKENIPGNFIETGVWRGGACILMRAMLAAYDVTDRKVFCADSFEGLPKPNAEKYRADRRDRLFAFSELAVSEDQVRKNFARYDLLDDQVVFLKGWFKDTLPKLGGEKFALIRLDGDMYESTMDALTNLYDRLADRGFVIIDDYGGLKNCRQAVHDFLDARALKPEIKKIDDTGVWWRKQL
jgi:O-methyltransferase